MNISKQVVLTLTAVCIVALSGTVRAADVVVRQPNGAEIDMPVNCPVMNTRFEVRKDTPVIDYDGKSYYFCCSHCLEEFKKNPDKYAGEGELPLRLPTKDEIGKSETCPVSRIEFQVVSETQVIDYKGKSYYFCCTPCVIDFRKNPEQYSK
jgi:YHS domain-containing protein